jgi:uncharacterized membrane protein
VPIAAYLGLGCSETGPGEALLDARIDAPSLDATAHDLDAAVDATVPTDAPLAQDAASQDAEQETRSDASAARDASVDAAQPPPQCTDVVIAACPTPALRYVDVKPIFDQRCISCHSPSWTGPWPLDTYGHVADWQDDIRTNLLRCSMPPPDAGIPITTEERRQILTWLACGLLM